jgi:hypothetical protein
LDYSAQTRSGVYTLLERYRTLLNGNVHDTPGQPMTAQLIENTMNGIRHVFDEADATVMTLMSTGSFARFRSGAFYQRLIDSLKVNTDGSSPVLGARGSPRRAAAAVGSELHVSSIVGSGGNGNHSPNHGAMIAPGSPPPPHVVSSINGPRYGIHGGPRFYSRNDPSPQGVYQSNISHGSPIIGHPNGINNNNNNNNNNINNNNNDAPSPPAIVWIDPALPATQSHTSTSPFSSRSPLPGATTSAAALIPSNGLTNNGSHTSTNSEHRPHIRVVSSNLAAIAASTSALPMIVAPITPTGAAGALVSVSSATASTGVSYRRDLPVFHE